MLVIEGSQGEGGGQILRTSLTMAMVTGTEIRVENIRAGRKKPGLMRQHLACVRAAQAVSDATVSGAEIGSTEINFNPKAVKSGEYHFSVGTAGSTMLVFQTVLPALALVDGESRLSFEGGTHNFFAPSFDFIALAFAPLLRQMGVAIEMEISRYGFYPQGGGQWQAVIKPSGCIGRLELVDAGELLSKEAVVTSANIPNHVATRELNEVAKLSNWPENVLKVKNIKCIGSGNIVSMRLHYAHCSEVVEHVGKLGMAAEKVARRAVQAICRYQASTAPVGVYLADQLMLLMAVGKGGVFRTMKPSLHSQTNRDVIHLFTDRRFQFEQLAEDLWEVRICS